MTWAFVVVGTFYRIRTIVYRCFYRAIFYTDFYTAGWDELKVTDTAEELAERYLDVDDVDGAIWSAKRGLDASPTHTRLTHLLMRAYFAAGDAKAAERVYESYVSALDNCSSTRSTRTSPRRMSRSDAARLPPDETEAARDHSVALEIRSQTPGLAILLPKPTRQRPPFTPRRNAGV